MLSSSRMPAPLSCVVAAMLGAAAGPATGRADTGADDSGLETVMVYARRLTPVSRVAATVTVIDQARIETTLATDIRELVRYEPGLSVRNDPFRFGLDTISIRGLGGNRVAVEIDGIPAAGGFAVGSYADSGRAYVDAAFVDRVEFLRGPASSLYGSDAIGGVVAMTTLTPASLLARGAGEYAVRTDAGFDSESDGWRAAALAAGAVGGTQWLVGYSRREGHESDTAADVTPNPSEYTNDSALLKVTGAVPGGPLTFTAEAGRLQQATDVDAFLGVGRFLNTTALAGDDEMLRYRISLGQALAAANAAFDSADWSAYWQGTETEQDTYEVRRAVPPRTPPSQLDRTFNFDESTFGVEFTAVKSLGSGSIVHDVVYGIEATRSELDELRNGLQTNLATGATTPTILGETFPLRDLPLSTVVEIGAFVQDEMQFDDCAVDPRARAARRLLRSLARDGSHLPRGQSRDRTGECRRGFVRSQARCDVSGQRPGRRLFPVRARLSFAAARGRQHRARGSAVQHPCDSEPEPAARDERRFRGGSAADGRPRGADRQRVPDGIQRLHRVEGEPGRRSGDRRDAVPVAERRGGAHLRRRVRRPRGRVRVVATAGRMERAGSRVRGPAATTSLATCRSIRSIRRGWCSACATTHRRRDGDRNWR